MTAPAWTPPADPRDRSQIIGIGDFSPRSDARPALAFCYARDDHLLVKHIYEGRQVSWIEQLEGLMSRYPGRGFAFNPLPRSLQQDINLWGRQNDVVIFTQAKRDLLHGSHLDEVRWNLDSGRIRLGADVRIKRDEDMEAVFFAWKFHIRPPPVVSFFDPDRPRRRT